MSNNNESVFGEPVLSADVSSKLMERINEAESKNNKKSAPATQENVVKSQSKSSDEYPYADTIKEDKKKLVSYLFGTSIPNIYDVENVLKSNSSDESKFTGTFLPVTVVEFDEYTYTILNFNNGTHFEVLVCASGPIDKPVRNYIEDKVNGVHEDYWIYLGSINRGTNFSLNN